MRRLTRSTHDKMLAGVAAGLATYLDIDPTLARIAWLVAFFATGGMALFAYLAFWFVMPRGDQVYPY